MKTQIEEIKSLKASYAFCINAEQKAFLAAKEIESVNFIIAKLKDEELFCKKHSADFTCNPYLYHMVSQCEKREKALQKKLSLLKIIAHQLIHLN